MIDIRKSKSDYNIPFHIKRIIIMLSLLLSGCSSLTTREAKTIELGFEGEYHHVPPRGLGRLIRTYIDDYEEITDVHLLRRYSLMSLSSMRRVNMAYGCNYYEKEIERLFFVGELETALKANELFFGEFCRDRSPQWKALTYVKRAIYLAEIGDFLSADEAFQKASRGISWWRWQNETQFFEAVGEYHLSRAVASIHFASGDMKKAESRYRQMLAWNARVIKIGKQSGRENMLIDQGWNTWRLATAEAGIAQSLMRQDRLVEAELWARNAIHHAEDYTIPYCFVTLADIFHAQGKYQYTEELCRTVIRYTSAHKFPDSALIRAKARHVLAKSYSAMHQWKNVLDQFARIEKEMQSDPETFDMRFRGSPYWGIALVMNNRAAEGLRQLHVSLDRIKSRYGKDHYRALEAKALTAIAENRLNRTNTALEIFEKTVPRMIERWFEPSGERARPKSREHKFRLIIEEYLELLSDRDAAGDRETGFIIATSLQNSSVANAVFKSSARMVPDDPELGKLIRQMQDLELKSNACQERIITILKGPFAFRNDTTINQLERKITEFNKALSMLNDEVKSNFSHYFAIINPSITSIDRVRDMLQNDESLIATFVGRDQTYVWAFGKTTPVEFSCAPFGQEELAADIEAIRQTLWPEQIETLSDIPNFDLDSAFDLYRGLLQPVEVGWKKTRTIFFIADGPLGQLPLSVLPTRTSSIDSDGGLLFSGHRNVPWLAKTHAVTLLPSPIALIHLRSFQGGRVERAPFAGFGDPWFRKDHLGHPARMKDRGAIRRRALIVTNTMESAGVSKLPHLPETADEIRAIAESLGADLDRDIFVGKRASEKMVKDMDLSNREVLMFATHGLVPGDLDGLDQPALALTAPEVAGDEENDGLLTMGEIMGLELNADWVILSACNTAAPDGDGAEAISGLGQAFFYAGAKSLLVTSWPVETTSATALTTKLFRMEAANHGITRAEALQRAKLALIDDGVGDGFSYAHPLFWAPFIIVGEGGAR